MEHDDDDSNSGRLEENGEGDSTSSCVSEVQEAHEDAQVLRVLDAMDHLLLCRESLAKFLSQGWMEIASARYSMGPSRIDQALFSLKPCPASTLVSISRADDFVNDEAHDGEGEECISQQEIHFTLESPHKIKPRGDPTFGYESSKSDVLSGSHLRQRHSSGSANMQHTGNDLDNGQDLGNDGDLAQDMQNKLKESDPLAWFGTLVSPHLRAAQSSFKEALETIAELATTQSTILMAYQQTQESGGLIKLSLHLDVITLGTIKDTKKRKTQKRILEEMPPYELEAKSIKTAKAAYLTKKQLEASSTAIVTSKFKAEEGHKVELQLMPREIYKVTTDPEIKEANSRLGLRRYYEKEP
ncbi:hypothetical protein L7F22_034144 [Adiantum nelumboides]|nr:hypothetical protein [Adiantum nelumboides]